MVKILSVIIACILTVLLACMLYPIACLFWIIARLGKYIGLVSEWIFRNANKAVKYLWADLRSVSE